MKGNVGNVSAMLFLAGILLTACNRDEVVVEEVESRQRLVTSSSKADFNKVYAYMPAPGQFINEQVALHTMEEACRYAENRMWNGNYVSLGAFGGYVTVGFDHSIVNTSGYDFAVKGNAFEGSSEPGIVWVMQDENGNGLPDDTWYELAGSEYGKAETISGYAVTYYRPSEPKQPVTWTDNMGRSGEVDYLDAFHKQDTYYPLWVETGSYTLTGTCLQSRNYDQSGNGTYWVQPAYDWGYADNFSQVDGLFHDGNFNGGVSANYFDIGNAVDKHGNRKELPYIDFVKVQTGLNTKSGWLGENSTEVFGIADCSSCFAE